MVRRKLIFPDLSDIFLVSFQDVIKDVKSGDFYFVIFTYIEVSRKYELRNLLIERNRWMFSLRML